VTGATIDHMVSVTILIAALLVAMMTYNGLFASAVDYDRNRQVANKAVDIMNTICLSPGSPIDWGETNASVLGFGLQDPEAGGYALSPYSIMRLKTATNDSQLIEYPPGSGSFYNNISANFGDAILTPLGDCINYTTATELLGINETYGFSIDITPTLNVIISKVPGVSYLIFKIDVIGSALPLSGATLNYYLFHVDKGVATSTIVAYSGVEETNSSGSALIEFPTLDPDDDSDAYHFMVYARLGGLNGIGYYSQDALDAYPQFVVPLICDYDEGIIMIAHSWGVHEYTTTPVPDVSYNATFYVLTSDFNLQQVEIENSTGQLNYGSKDYETTQIPASEVGLLFISYRWSNRLGSVVLPWGVGTLGVSASFSSGSDPGDYDFVATELRQVTIDNISYQMKVSTWSLSG
jgi:hypothetical protein